jgi:hypothetical protein
MQKTIFALLTDESARNAVVVEASLDQEFAVGAPWFSKSPELFLDVNPVI